MVGWEVGAIENNIQQGYLHSLPCGPPVWGGVSGYIQWKEHVCILLQRFLSV